MEKGPSWEANCLQLVKKFSAFYGTQKFRTALTSARHLSLFWASPIHSSHPHPTSWSSILTLSSHLRLGLPSGLFPSDFPTRTLYTTLPSPIRATCPAHLNRLDFITLTMLGKEYRHYNIILHYYIKILRDHRVVSAVRRFLKRCYAAHDCTVITQNFKSAYVCVFVEIRVIVPHILNIS
jgi:hypothetical protein